jgi:hypothetical protein
MTTQRWMNTTVEKPMSKVNIKLAWLGGVVLLATGAVMGTEPIKATETPQHTIPVVAASTPDVALANDRRIFKEQQAAVVSVMGVVSFELDGERQEGDFESVGTVLDGNGLTAVSCMKVDPIFAIGEIIKHQSGTASIQGVVSKLRIQLADGTDIPAKIVYRDADIDLALLMPDTAKPLPPFMHVIIKDRAELDVLEPLISIVRLPPIYQRRAAVGRCTVAAKLAGPQAYCVVAGDSGTQAGAPFFRNDGTLAGIALMYRAALERDVTGEETVLLSSKHIRNAMMEASTKNVEKTAPPAAPAK